MAASPARSSAQPPRPALRQRRPALRQRHPALPDPDGGAAGRPGPGTGLRAEAARKRPPEHPVMDKNERCRRPNWPSRLSEMMTWQPA
ncbi:hypothetical protein J1605_011754 [Eschrichtius robustus]|uniref:Uncharacterized protein n=1 Tax=Eschrichtius robustus TaxID=9764 RepID=A0AB34GPA8_ESCRO|nr:hypothetical protein J1605_011754 [Eschrichtius robustus]